MQIETVLYLINVINNLDCVLTITFIVLAATIACWCMKCAYDDIDGEEKKETNKSVLKRLILSLVLVACIATAIPSERTMYMMVGSHYLKQSKLPSNVYALINKKINDLLIEKKKQ